MEGASGGCPYNRNGRLSLSTGGAELSGAAVRRGTVSVQRRTGQVPPPSGGDMTEFNSNDDMDIDLPPEWSTGSTQRSEAGGVLRFSTVDWEERARVAENGAERLQGVIDSLRGVRDVNHFGDCVEGHNMHARVSAAITAWRLEVTRQREQLIQLAAIAGLRGKG